MIDYRRKLQENNIPLWEVCYFLGVSENTLCRWLRDDALDEIQAHRIDSAIDKVLLSRAETQEAVLKAMAGKMAN